MKGRRDSCSALARQEHRIGSLEPIFVAMLRRVAKNGRAFLLSSLGMSTATDSVRLPGSVCSAKLSSAGLAGLSRRRRPATLGEKAPGEACLPLRPGPLGRRRRGPPEQSLPHWLCGPAVPSADRCPRAKALASEGPPPFPGERRRPAGQIYFAVSIQLRFLAR